jgi:hypothetical protein
VVVVLVAVAEVLVPGIVCVRGVLRWFALSMSPCRRFAPISMETALERPGMKGWPAISTMRMAVAS